MTETATTPVVPKKYNMIITFETLDVTDPANPLPFSTSTQKYFNLNDAGVSMIETEGIALLSKLRENGDALKGLKKA